MQLQAIAKARPLPAPVSGTPGAALSAKLQPISAAGDFEALVAPFARSVFQSALWLSTWLGTMPGPEVEGCYWLSVEEAGGEPVLALPLVLRRERSGRLLSTPDLGVSDYNPPLLGHPEIVARQSAEALWKAIRPALPEADLLHLKRMPLVLAGVPNPLVHHGFAVPDRISGWVVDLPERWEDYFARLTPKMREKLGKCRRRFLRQPGARFKITEDAGEAITWLRRFDSLQRERIEDKGAPYILDQEPYAGFYRALARGGLPQKRVAMAAALAGEEIVAVNFAVRDGTTAVYLRVANQFGPWAPMAPGLLVTEHLMQHLHAQGVRTFDFAMGDYAYKRRFGAERLPLVTVEIPLNTMSVPGAALRYFYRRLAVSPRMRALRDRWKNGRGTPPAPPSCD
ncbi:MAG: GNAT family N-acetyltransferase [Methylobacterium sp.]|nr:GNAT family N-acetyltransferase [Methylobacterium sp.]MCA3605120.1 GNAT family N-acetyltransferase [Methylobacterium sp.]MCA3608861.1 GNAT family N-acetyltransferase [Methylobacterium sp.]MCA3610999.1 GNAT family N-acetyltransferase [Methylobacterium sp.]MCA3619340.1 GNAT family N-acetyltransferase [Methylobacterium sp.]